MGKNIVVCLLSGGVDSTVAATMKALEPDTSISLLSIYYGQGAQSAEREHSVLVAGWLAQHFNSVVEHFVLEIGGHIRWSRRPAVGGQLLSGFVGWRSPQGGWPQAGYPSTRDETFVLMAAAGLEARLRDSEDARSGEVVLATTKEDTANFDDIDPTTYTEHLAAVLDRKLIPQMGKPMRIALPLIGMSKADVVRKGVEIGAPLELTWSCYFGEPGRPCMECDQCRWRSAAFSAVGITDQAQQGLVLPGGQKAVL